MEEQIKIIKIKEDNKEYQTVLSNLVKMYCCEWSEYNLLDVDELGLYPFEKYLPSFWTNTDKHAFLLKYQDKWAGFALIDKDFTIHKDFDYSMSEFFILPKYRKNGFGKYLSYYLFDKFPGSWEIGRNPKNKRSVTFWDKIIKEYTNNDYEVVYCAKEHQYSDGTLGDVLSFNNEK